MGEATIFAVIFLTNKQLNQSGNQKTSWENPMKHITSKAALNKVPKMLIHIYQMCVL